MHLELSMAKKKQFWEMEIQGHAQRYIDLRSESEIKEVSGKRIGKPKSSGC